MTNEDMEQVGRGDVLIDANGTQWIVTDFTHTGGRRMPTVVRTMVITFPNPWRRLEVPDDRS